MNKLSLCLLLFLMLAISGFSQEKKYSTYKAQKGETVYSISQKYSITANDLLKLNPDLKDGVKENQIIIVPNKDFKPALESIKGDYVDGGFLYHKVLPKENYYRLKKEFGVPKRILRRHNLALRTGGLKVGQIIKIPVDSDVNIANVPLKEDTTTKPYLVKPKETKYSISRRYGITIEMLEELNPQIKAGLKLAQIIKVPNTLEIPDPDENFTLHQIEKGETLFSLSQKFKMSQVQLQELNPELKEGVKEGALIKIPRLLTLVNTSQFTAGPLAQKQVNIAMLLPFMSKKSDLDFENDRTLNIVTDFYLGALMAIDSLKQQGLSVHVKVFDTQNSQTEIAQILKFNEIHKMDAIVGPMFLDNVKFISQSLSKDSIAIISPVSSKDHKTFASKNIIQETPSDAILADVMIDYIAKNFTGQQLIVIADVDTEENKVELKRIVDRLKVIDSIKEIPVLQPEKGYIKPDLFKETIKVDKENIIVLISNDKVVTADVVNNLGVMPEKIKATLYSTSFGSNFEGVDNNFLARVKLHYPTSQFIDLNDYQIKKFIKKFKTKNHVEPSEYAFKGFDITYDALLRLATYKNFEQAFDGGISKRMSSKFIYTKKAGTGFENKGVFLVKYEGLDLKNIE